MTPIRSITILLIISTLTGCASSGTYWKNRGADAKDILTLGAERGGLAVTAQVGPLMSGLAYAEDGEGFGLRGGNLGEYTFTDFQFLLAGEKMYFREGADPRRKFCSTTQLLCINTGWNFDRGPHRANHRIHMYGGLEASVVCGVGIRAGVNVAEIVDFVLGFGTIDIMRDDLLEGALEHLKGIE